MNNTTDDYTHYKRNTPHGLENSRPITSSTRLILSIAQEQGIKVEQINSTQVFKLDYKNETRYFHFQNAGCNSVTGDFIVNRKKNTRNLLKSIGVSVPTGYSLRSSDSDEYLKEVYDSLEKPLVVKPDVGGQGKGISVGVESLFEYIMAVRKAFNYNKKKDSWIVVEEQLMGFDEYRVLTTQHKVIGVIKRIPANVIGDGESNIRKLIKVKNSDPRRKDAEDHPPLFKIEFDEDMKEYLQKQGLSWKHVPKNGEIIYLRGVSNISMGGDSIDFTDRVHPSVNKICIDAIRSVPGLVLGGVDFMTNDVTKKQDPSSYAILEINNSPGLDIHDYPFEGVNRQAALEFLKVLFDVSDFN